MAKSSQQTRIANVDRDLAKLDFWLWQVSFLLRIMRNNETFAAAVRLEREAEAVLSNNDSTTGVWSWHGAIGKLNILRNAAVECARDHPWFLDTLRTTLNETRPGPRESWYTTEIQLAEAVAYYTTTTRLHLITTRFPSHFKSAAFTDCPVLHIVLLCRRWLYMNCATTEVTYPFVTGNALLKTIGHPEKWLPGEESQELQNLLSHYWKEHKQQLQQWWDPAAHPRNTATSRTEYIARVQRSINTFTTYQDTYPVTESHAAGNPWAGTVRTRDTSGGYLNGVYFDGLVMQLFESIIYAKYDDTKSERQFAYPVAGSAAVENTRDVLLTRQYERLNDFLEKLEQEKHPLRSIFRWCRTAAGLEYICDFLMTTFSQASSHVKEIIDLNIYIAEAEKVHKADAYRGRISILCSFYRSNQPFRQELRAGQSLAAQSGMPDIVQAFLQRNKQAITEFFSLLLSQAWDRTLENVTVLDSVFMANMRLFITTAASIDNTIQYVFDSVNGRSMRGFGGDWQRLLAIYLHQVQHTPYLMVLHNAAMSDLHLSVGNMMTVRYTYEDILWSLKQLQYERIRQALPIESQRRAAITQSRRDILNSQELAVSGSVVSRTHNIVAHDVPRGTHHLVLMKGEAVMAEAVPSLAAPPKERPGGPWALYSHTHNSFLGTLFQQPVLRRTGQPSLVFANYSAVSHCYPDLWEDWDILPVQLQPTCVVLYHAAAGAPRVYLYKITSQGVIWSHDRRAGMQFASTTDFEELIQLLENKTHYTMSSIRTVKAADIHTEVLSYREMYPARNTKTKDANLEKRAILLTDD